MSRPKTILRTDDHRNVPIVLLSEVHDLPHRRPNSFFHRWLDRWSRQNKSAQNDPVQKQAVTK